MKAELVCCAFVEGVKKMETRQSSRRLLRKRPSVNSTTSNSRTATTSANIKTKSSTIDKRKLTSGKLKTSKQSTATHGKRDTNGTVLKQQLQPSKSNETIKLQRSKSFERYGIVLPKYEDCLEYFKKTEEYEKKVKRLEKLENFDITPPYDFNDKIKKQPTSPQNYFDCKHLTTEQIDGGFDKYKSILSGILNEKILCKRHEQYYKCDRRTLINNTDSLIVFNQEQKLHMLNLLHKTFDSSDRLINYFFTVLLPELCLFIFMDTHCMTRKQAEKYLEDRPIDS